jgi:hypothetical protein
VVGLAARAEKGGASPCASRGHEATRAALCAGCAAVQIGVGGACRALVVATRAGPPRQGDSCASRAVLAVGGGVAVVVDVADAAEKGAAGTAGAGGDKGAGRTRGGAGSGAVAVDIRAASGTGKETTGADLTGGHVHTRVAHETCSSGIRVYIDSTSQTLIAATRARTAGKWDTRAGRTGEARSGGVIVVIDGADWAEVIGACAT